MQLFRSDIKIDNSLINTITIRSFTRHINSASNIMPTFIRVKHGYPSKVKYILVSPDELDQYHENVLQVNNSKAILPRNLDKRLRSHQKVSSQQSTTITPDAPTGEPTLMPSPHLDDHDHQQHNNTMKSSDHILNMSKSDFASSLKFFMGKERSDQIVNQKKFECEALGIMSDNISYKHILESHL